MNRRLMNFEMLKLSMCHKTTLASDASIDFQINFYLIGEIVTHWFTYIMLSALRRSGNENKLNSHKDRHGADEVLKVKNFKKDAPLKLFMLSYQEMYEHVRPKSQVHKMERLLDDIKRLCLVNDLNKFKITFIHVKDTSQSLKSKITTTYHKLMIEVKDYELKTRVKATSRSQPYVKWKFSHTFFYSQLLGRGHGSVQFVPYRGYFAFAGYFVDAHIQNIHLASYGNLIWKAQRWTVRICLEQLDHYELIPRFNNDVAALIWFWDIGCVITCCVCSLYSTEKRVRVLMFALLNGRVLSTKCDLLYDWCCSSDGRAVADRPEEVELAAKCCYEANIELSTENIALARCVAEYIEMTEEFANGNCLTSTSVNCDMILKDGSEGSLDRRHGDISGQCTAIQLSIWYLLFPEITSTLTTDNIYNKTNTDCLVKEQEKVHLGIKVGANITVTGVPGQEGAEGNVAGKKKVKESMKANLGKLLKYNAWSTRWSPIRGSSTRKRC
ncbi:hypothetical protein Tco_1400785 [Tanacetum coccineum]